MTHKNQELYDALLYISWVNFMDLDQCFLYLDTKEQFNNFVKNAQVHFGDCTKDPCTCNRCVLHECEITAQRMYNYLHLSEYTREENKTDAVKEN